MGNEEKRIETGIRRWIEANGGMSLKYRVGLYEQAGTPDLIGCFRGRGFVIEVKAPDGKVRKLQSITLDRWRERSNAITGVVYSVQDAIDLLLGGTENAHSRNQRYVEVDNGDRVSA